MKMLFLVTDSEYEPQCLNIMREEGIAGFTVIPNAFGVGKNGVKMGDRYHPGASVLIISAIEDQRIEEVMSCIQRCVLSNKLCESTHAWILPIEQTLNK